jgi:hypothetical protein
MPVTLTDVNNGTVAGDDTGESAFDAFAKVNTNNGTLEAAVADLVDTETISGAWTFTNAAGLKTSTDLWVG